MDEAAWPEEARARVRELERELARLHVASDDAAQHRQLFLQHPLPMFVLDAQTLAIVDVNEAACAHYGWSRAEFCRMNARDIRPSEDLPRYQEVVESLRDGDVTPCDFRHVTRDGRVIRVHVRTRFFHHEGRRLRLSVVTDVTRERAAEETLARTLGQLQLILDTTSELVMLLSRDASGGLRCEAPNRALLQTWGLTYEALAGRPLAELLPERDRLAFEGWCDKALRTGAPVRALGVRFGRATRIFDVRLHPVGEAQGGGAHVLCSARDVTEEHQLRERLQLADRMASLGTLAAGVAHEVNNPLAFALANLAFLELEFARARRTGLALGEESAQALRDAQDGLERVRQIVRELKVFSRPGEDEPQAVEVWPVLEAALQLVQNELRHRARLVRAAGDVPPVRATAARLGQLFVNLLANAVHALGDGDPAQQRIELSTRLHPGGLVEIAVADSGRGIDPEVLPRIFEPFFTTKPVGEGTGLGLAVCDGIVRSFGGRIEVESTPGAGSVFRVLLPAAERVAHTAVEAPAPRPARRRGRLLVIDDEPTAVKAFERLLGAEHEVTVLPGASEALVRLDAGERFDVILCDLMMPQMSGMEFHAQVLARHPQQEPRILFVTAGAFSDKARQFAEQMEPRLLEKPFDLALLRQSVERLLG